MDRLRLLVLVGVGLPGVLSLRLQLLDLLPQGLGSRLQLAHLLAQLVAAGAHLHLVLLGLEYFLGLLKGVF